MRSFFRCLSSYLSAAHQFDLISLSVNALRFLTLDAIESAGEEEEEESGEEIRKIVLGNGGVSGKIC